MNVNSNSDPIGECLANFATIRLDPLDLLPRRELVEKMIELDLLGIPAGPSRVVAELRALSQVLAGVDAKEVKVVVFGGGTGLSTVIGGDSCHPDWAKDPFAGLKAVFPQTRAIVCVTDDGGSSGELLKELPLIALGDLRHVLLSSIRRARLREQYGLDDEGALRVAAVLFNLFNYRFHSRPANIEELLAAGGIELGALPAKMARVLADILGGLFSDPRLAKTLSRPHCLGNLLLAAAIYRQGGGGEEPGESAISDGLGLVAELIGVERRAVLPCTLTPCRLRVRYANGVLVTGEEKSSRARRGSPVDRVSVEFSSPPKVDPAVLASIAEAELILFAPGSLYTSIVPIMQVPGLSEAVRQNRRALKILMANLWIQKGETDLVRDDPGRRFYVSDLIAAYHRNIPGGVEGLFRQVLILGLQDIPGSILQSYALEDKLPIYLDRGKVWEMGFSPLEARIFSEKALHESRVKHDPQSLAKALRIVWVGRGHLPEPGECRLPAACPPLLQPLARTDGQTAQARYAALVELLAGLVMEATKRVAEILWRHADIPLAHLALIRGVRLIPMEEWGRCQEWDNVYSFYDPSDALIKIRADIGAEPRRFEVAFLVALGQSLLGDYAADKSIRPMVRDGVQLGKVYELTLRPPRERHCFFSSEELQRYLLLARMQPIAGTPPSLYVRLLNGSEGFTPPGLFFGLAYAWYLDNRFAAHVEYKMAITRMEVSDLIPEQQKSRSRRRETIDFFRQVVFGHR